MVSIGRALAQANARVLILDEPTSSLATAEADGVLEAIRHLASSGMCVIYVSHQLDEIVRVADAFTVLRNGETVDRGSMAAFGPRLTRSLWAGTDAGPPPPRARQELLSLVVGGRRLPVGASLDLYARDLGIAGLVGPGRRLVQRSALDRTKSGLRVAVGGRLCTQRGQSQCGSPEIGGEQDRKAEGPRSMSVAGNSPLAWPFVRVIDDGKQRSAARRIVDRPGSDARDIGTGGRAVGRQPAKVPSGSSHRTCSCSMSRPGASTSKQREYPARIRQLRQGDPVDLEQLDGFARV
jgi:ABC-type sugar transport system ATPase subunit